MNAYDLYEAAFDTAQAEVAEPTASYVEEYAFGALDMAITTEVAEVIAEVRRNWLDLVDAGEADSNAKYQRVQAVLEDIEL
ncbi:hypothetical protein BU332_22700 [Salmonella enterica]|nr:hypothetical protein [Salmonella enterica]EBR1292727.1 hypothetical protein [Salmonella enterica]